MSEPEPEPQPSPARQRAEARKQKLLTQGNDRLAKITGAMKGHQSPSIPIQSSSPLIPSTQTHPDPPEVDISNLSNTSPSLLKSSSSNHLSSLNQSIRSTPSRTNLGASSINAGNDSIIDDSMFEMMKSMGLQLPIDPSSTTTNLKSNGLGSLNHQPPSNLFNQQPQPQEKRSKDWIELGLGLLTITSIFGIIYKNYTSQSMLEFQNHSLGITHQNLSPTPIFWMFMSIEISLQVTRWFFKRNTPQNNNNNTGMLLRTLAGSLPSPYSNLILIGIRYVGFFDEFLNHFCLLVFGLGWVLVYLDSKSVVNEFGWGTFFLP